MDKKRVEDCFNQYEFMEQELLTEEQRRIFRIAYKMGWDDRVTDGGKLPVSPERE